MYFRPITFPLFFLICSLFATAESFTLDTGVDFALRHNPTLASARLVIEEARARHLNSGRLANPELETEISPNARGREYAASIMLSQQFPLTKRLQQERNISHTAISAAFAEVELACRGIASETKSLIIKSHVLRQSMDKKRQIQTALESLTKQMDDAASRGEGSMVESSQASLASQQIAMELLLMESELEQHLAELKTVLGLDALRSVEISGELGDDRIPEFNSTGLAQHPELLMAGYKVTMAEEQVALEMSGKWQDVEVGIGAGAERSEDAPDGLQTEAIIGFRVAVPLPFWNQNQGKVAEAEATLQRFVLEKVAVEARLRSEAHSALASMRRSRDIINRSDQTLLPKAKEMEEQLASFLSQGQPEVRVADVTRARESRFALEQSRLIALQSFHLAKVKYDSVCGPSLSSYTQLAPQNK